MKMILDIPDDKHRKLKELKKESRIPMCWLINEAIKNFLYLKGKLSNKEK